jgi:hypothetical protein
MKTNTLLIGAVALTASALLSSCDDAGTIGESLLPIENTIIVEDDFTVTGHSVSNERIQSRTITQLLGKIDAEGYGNFSSDFVTQFMPAASLDTTLTSASAIDSLKLVMMYYNDGIVGDSIVPMGLEVYRLNKNLQAPIYSDFNPEDYYDASAPIASTIYGASNLELNDSLKELEYKSIYVDLPRSLAVELYNVYKNNPAAYLDPTQFSQYFHGFYVKNSYGAGRVTKVQGTVMQMYYHYDTVTDEGNDTTYNYVGNYYSVSPEIITNNNINYTMSPDLLRRVDQGENLIVAPAGLEVEMTFPLLDIIDRYRSKAGQLAIVNDLTLSIPASTISNDYSIKPPEYLLLILKNKKKEFFEKSSLTDSETSFYAEYDSSTGSYDFSSMRQYLLNALNSTEPITEDDYTFVITPVSVNTETNSSSYYYTTTVVSSIVPYIEQPAMVKLNLDKAKIVLTFSNQNLKN